MTKGFGSWAEVIAMDRFERLAVYYGVMQMEGMTIDWTSGEVTRPAIRTLRRTD